MAKRTNHYDVAFEELLREMRRPYVAVDERRRALAQESSLKSFDFVVYSPRGQNMLVDVKGRRFAKGGQRLWTNWASQEDIDSLLKWQQVFGGNFRSLLLFTYELETTRWWPRHQLIWEYRHRQYAFYGVWVDEYAAAMKTLCAKWDTVAVSAADFRRLRREILDLL